MPNFRFYSKTNGFTDLNVLVHWVLMLMIFLSVGSTSYFSGLHSYCRLRILRTLCLLLVKRGGVAHHIFARKVILKIAQGVTSPRHRPNKGDEGSGGAPPG